MTHNKEYMVIIVYSLLWESRIYIINRMTWPLRINLARNDIGDDGAKVGCAAVADGEYLKSPVPFY